MKQRFWVLVLITSLIIGNAVKWSLPAKVVTIGCSVLVLMQVVLRLRELFTRREDPNVTK